MITTIALLIINLFSLNKMASDSMSALYSITFQTVAGDTFSVNNCLEKRIIVFEFDAGNPDLNQLKIFDSLATSNAFNLQIIGIPATDFSEVTAPDSVLKLLSDSMDLHFPIAESGRVRKEDGSQQLEIMRWICSKTENGHVNNEIKEPGQIFIVNSKGILYGSLTKDILFQQELLQYLLDNEPVE